MVAVTGARPTGNQVTVPSIRSSPVLATTTVRLAGPPDDAVPAAQYHVEASTSPASATGIGATTARPKARRASGAASRSRMPSTARVAATNTTAVPRARVTPAPPAAGGRRR